MPKESGWVTINGVHVFIDNSGKITKGPAKFIGRTTDNLPSSGKGKESQTDNSESSKDSGWSHKDINTFNSMRTDAIGLEWSGSRLSVTYKGKPFAVVEPIVNVYGDSVFEVVGRVGSYFDKEMTYKTAASAKRAIMNSVSRATKSKNPSASSRPSTGNPAFDNATISNSKKVK